MSTFPAAWRTGCLADLCTWITDSALPAESGAPIYVGLEHIDGGSFRLNAFASPNDFKSNSYRFARGDVLYGKLRPYLDKAAIAPSAGVCSTEILVLRPKESVPAEFILGVLHSPEFINYAQSSADKQYPRTSWNWISQFSLSLPTESIEQQRIAAVLSIVQEAVETEGELVRVTRELKQAALRQLFTRGLRGEPQKETEIGPVPESWEVVPLDVVVKARGGSAFPHSYQGKKHGDLPFYKVSDMNLPGNEVFMKSANNRVDREVADELGAKTFPKDTIVFPKVGGALLTNKKRRLTCEALLDNNMMGVVSLDQKKCSPDFLQQWFETVDLRTLAAPGPLPSLNNARLYECKLPLPSPDEQREIAALLRTIDDKIAHHEQRKKLLRELFRTLLHDLMTARRRVGDDTGLAMEVTG